MQQEPVAAEQEPTFGSTVTILFSDLRGFTDFTNAHGDAAAYRVVRVYNTLIEEQVALHGGHIVKTQGDSWMVSFDSARRALNCAIAMQAATTHATALDGDIGLKTGIGINSGEPVYDDGDFFGSTVNLAARGCARSDSCLGNGPPARWEARPGAICRPRSSPCQRLSPASARVRSGLDGACPRGRRSRTRPAFGQSCAGGPACTGHAARADHATVAVARTGHIGRGHRGGRTRGCRVFLRCVRIRVTPARASATGCRQFLRSRLGSVPEQSAGPNPAYSIPAAVD